MQSAFETYPKHPGESHYSKNIISRLTLLSMFVAIGMLAVGSVTLFQARRDAWQQAEQSSTNLAVALERDIARNIAVFDLSLQGAIQALQEPGIDKVDSQMKQLFVFDRSASAEYLGSILVLDANGDVTLNSQSINSIHFNYSDRDYFQYHKDHFDVGPYISRPFRSRLRGGDPSIAISRRLPGLNGHFQGIVQGSLRLAYFQNLFGKLDLGQRGTITLTRTDGRILARQPWQEADLDRDVSKSDVFAKILASANGTFVGTSSFDGVERLYAIQHFANLPLVLSVAVAVDDIYAAWWQKALIIGVVLLLLCGSTVSLCLLFRQEILRRIKAERALFKAADELAVLASTDSLTGIANRRSLEIVLRREWRRAIRARSTISLLMLDVDFFKLYNDTYGHQEGDRVLQSIVKCIEQDIRRPGDDAGRYGGEEFVVILAETDCKGALVIATRIKTAIEGLHIPHSGNPYGVVTVSIGLAAVRPLRGELEELLVKKADLALYEAKHAGRNRINVARDDAKDTLIGP